MSGIVVPERVAKSLQRQRGVRAMQEALGCQCAIGALEGCGPDEPCRAVVMALTAARAAEAHCRLVWQRLPGGPAHR
jgi:hypothetical protein